ncbi:MAG: uracil-DNA glycosylase family protein [Calditrichia bacterium]
MPSYASLATARRSCNHCAGILTNASQIDDGRYDTDRIGAYSNWQDNLDSPIVLVGQDFADVAGFRTFKGWAGYNVGTNLTLIKLFESIGIDLEVPQLGAPNDKVFFTNAVLCMKKGVKGKSRRQQYIPAACYKNCQPFLRQTIDIVSPRVVLGIGKKAIQSVLRCYNVKMSLNMSEIAGKPVFLNANSVIIPLYHPSRTVQNTHRSFEQMLKDWRVVKKFL